MAGSEVQQLVIAFGPPGTPPYSQVSWDRHYVRRPFKNGDVVNFLIESSAAGGYWYDLRRFLCIGSIPKALQAAYEVAKEARNIMADNLKPGSPAAVALDASDEYLKSKGYPPEARVAAHGQGVDLVERPVIRREEPAAIETGMVISLHPNARKDHTVACLADTYVITDSGAVPIYKNLFDDNDIFLIN